MKIAIPSPFPWSPGHTIAEALYVVCAQLLSECRDEVTYCVLPGYVSTPFFAIYSEWFRQFNIRVVHDYGEISRLIYLHDSEDLMNAAISRCLHVHDTQLKDIATWRFSTEQSIYHELTGGRLKPILTSIEYESALNNELSTKLLACRDSRLRPPRYRLGLLEQFSKHLYERKVAIINIREHSANLVASMELSDYVPLIKMLQEEGFYVVDASHSAKGFKDELDALDVLPYWAFPNKSFLTDIELFSHSSIYIGSGGISLLPIFYQIPTINVGSIFPNCYNLDPRGYSIPCRLYDRVTGLALGKYDSFGQLLRQPSPFDKFYDDYGKTWGLTGNSSNCLETVSADFRVERPTSVTLLRATYELISNPNSLSKHVGEEYPFKDILGRWYVGSSLYGTWKL